MNMPTRLGEWILQRSKFGKWIGPLEEQESVGCYGYPLYRFMPFLGHTDLVLIIVFL
jgi:hypothetical protein